jgi:ssDNA-binding Zn-finger/Zn-ribbon topoisomerase 1
MRFLLENRTWCPKCGSICVQRRVRRTGRLFLGCSSWPICGYFYDAEKELEMDPEKLQAEYYLSPKQRLAIQEGYYGNYSGHNTLISRIIERRSVMNEKEKQGEAGEPNGNSPAEKRPPSIGSDKDQKN